jgi:hypothetical protein
MILAWIRIRKKTTMRIRNTGSCLDFFKTKNKETAEVFLFIKKIRPNTPFSVIPEKNFIIYRKSLSWGVNIDKKPPPLWEARGNIDCCHLRGCYEGT